MFVHDDPTVEREPATDEPTGGRPDPDANHDLVCEQVLAADECKPVRLDGVDRGVQPQRHAGLGIPVDHARADLVPERLRQRDVRSLDDGHRRTGGRGGRSHLRTDPARPDHREPQPRTQDLP